MSSGRKVAHVDADREVNDLCAEAVDAWDGLDQLDGGAKWLQVRPTPPAQRSRLLCAMVST